MEVAGELIDITLYRDLEDDKHYGVEVQVREGGVVTFFPISVY
ncbi:hypothetical protein [Microbacterium sp. NIBRBAC000506063]|nr:hypothetical protein [Microbacterium sp. NIBRBAC000506063]